MLSNINFLAATAAALSAFLLGGIWYSPLLFGNTWVKESGLTLEKCQHGHKKGVFTIAIFLSFIAAFSFAFALGPNPNLNHALLTACVVGIGWIATSIGINYAFAARSLKLFLIDSGYHFFQFIFYALILGLWH